MRHALKLHPDSHCTAAARIDVEIERPKPDLLILSYLVTGNPSALVLPPQTAPKRTDGLWQHTCFEVFLRNRSGKAYYEINLAPSSQWAAYSFSNYRNEMRIAHEVRAPQVEGKAESNNFRLRATLDLNALPDLAGESKWDLGLSAVLEETDGTKSYWALTHPPGKPDFHHSDCFAHELPAAWHP